MSLDFSLTPSPCKCPHCGGVVTNAPPREAFSRNITHNLTEMAKAAGIYEVLWHPNDSGQVTAKDVAPVLAAGLTYLRARPEYFSRFNSPNGWGRYEDFVPFVEAVLKACQDDPDATVHVSR